MNKQTFIWIILIGFGMQRCSIDELKAEFPNENKIIAKKKFKINLPENHKLGENWVLIDDYNHEIINHINSVWHGDQKGLDINFLALKQGKTTIKLKLLKMKDSVAVKQYIVDIQTK
ncbi:MAG: hypothetical protein IPM51_03590 [Sphingobacteriaceae bacterium]|nr:hypothetical protein [Sphingobacteriaceae bacterium]